MRTDDYCRLPPRGPKTDLVPADRLGRTVDVLGIVDRVALLVALDARQPRTRQDLPGAIGSDHVDRAVGVQDRYACDHARHTLRSTFAGPCQS